MTLNWAALWRQPQTYLLLVGAALGYAALIVIAGTRPMVWVGGAGIAAAMATAWGGGFRSSSPQAMNGADLLNASVLMQQLERLDKKLPKSTQAPWPQVRQQAVEAGRFAERMCDRDPLMRPDLLEALQTVIELARQVAEALQVMDHIETPTYRALAQQRLEASCDRMAETHAQLRQLQDQVALSSLDGGLGGALPQRLQTLIAANRQILNVDGNSEAIPSDESNR